MAQRFFRFLGLFVLLFWVDVTSIHFIARNYAFLPTDGCGQILDLPRIEAYELRFWLLRVALYTCLAAETFWPKLRAPAWGLVLALLSGTLLIGSHMLLTEAEFLTFCDIQFTRPHDVLTMNVLNALLLAGVTWVRFRRPA